MSYYKNNKEKLDKYFEIYRAEHREQIRANDIKNYHKRKQYVTCTCGCYILKTTMKKHLLTPKHKIHYINTV